LFLTAGKESFKPGDVIFKEGSHGVAVYLINSGRIEISKNIEGKKLVVETLGPGEIFGEMSFIDHESRSATATALEDTVLEILDKDFLDSRFNQISSDFRGIIRNLVKRLRKTTQRIGAVPGGAPSGRRAEDRTGSKIRIVFKRASDFFRAYISNLGAGGLFIKTTQTLPVGTVLQLDFNLPGSDYVIQTKGKVVWARPKEESDERKPPGLGIQFVRMRPEDNERIRIYITTYKF
jgi:uncharacterized protein (TIGR02266 family)